MGAVNRLAVALAFTGLFAVDAAAQQMTAVTQLGWLRNGEYAPIMMAEAKGFFKEEGLDHKIVDGGPGKNPIPIVAVGQAQFGLAANGMTIVTARLAKDPVDVVDMWYAESSLYRFPNGGFSMRTGHFTQLVWRASVGVGCATKVCSANNPFGQTGNWVFWVCDYSPAGNVGGQRPY